MTPFIVSLPTPIPTASNLPIKWSLVVHISLQKWWHLVQTVIVACLFHKIPMHCDIHTPYAHPHPHFDSDFIPKAASTDAEASVVKKVSCMGTRLHWYEAMTCAALIRSSVVVNGLTRHWDGFPWGVGINWLWKTSLLNFHVYDVTNVFNQGLTVYKRLIQCSLQA